MARDSFLRRKCRSMVIATSYASFPGVLSEGHRYGPICLRAVIVLLPSFVYKTPILFEDSELSQSNWFKILLLLLIARLYSL